MAYLNEILTQVKEWLQKMTVKKLVVVFKNTDTSEVLERWQFDVECDKSVTETSAPKQKAASEIEDEIRAIIRQITASITFLPLLECACSFDILIYTDKDLEVPEKWGVSGPALINDSEEVRLRSFNTLIHKVDGMVAYKKMTA